MVTYNTVVGDIKHFCDQHLQIAQFLHISTWDEEARNNVYVTAILVPQQSIINGNSISLNFNLFIVDLLNYDGSNKREVYSDTLEIVRDFLAYFTGSPCIDWTVGDNTTVTPINEIFEDEILAGWVLNFSVDMPFSMSQCNIPLSDLA